MIWELDFETYSTQRFTGAHELGHYLLHREEVMHRDWPIGGSSSGNGLCAEKGRQADYFAACYVMPEILVVSAF